MFFQVSAQQAGARGGIYFLHPPYGTQNKTGRGAVLAIALTSIHEHRDPLVLHQVGEFSGVAVSGKNQPLTFIDWRNGNQTGVWLPGTFSGKDGKTRAV